MAVSSGELTLRSWLRNSKKRKGLQGLQGGVGGKGKKEGGSEVKDPSECSFKSSTGSDSAAAENHGAINALW